MKRVACCNKFYAVAGYQKEYNTYVQSNMSEIDNLFLTRQEIEEGKLEGVNLHVEPKTPPLTREEFCSTRPPFSIALDGYVNAPPFFEQIGPCVNFDHHVGVERLATRATCAQVLLAIRQGLFETFQVNGVPRAEVYVNDCDEDEVLSWFALRYGCLSKNVYNPRLNRLIGINDLMDTTAATYPMSATDIDLQEYYWVLDPYKKFRLSGELDKKDANSYRGIFDSVEERVIRYLTGEGERIELDTCFELLHQGEGWSMVKEIGAQAKDGMFASGINAYVAVRLRPDGGAITYVYGKRSDYISGFNIQAITAECNKFEGIKETDSDRHGSSTTIGGSPRVAGSKITPEQMIEIVEKSRFGRK